MECIFSLGFLMVWLFIIVNTLKKNNKQPQQSTPNTSANQAYLDTKPSKTNTSSQKNAIMQRRENQKMTASETKELKSNIKKRMESQLSDMQAKKLSEHGVTGYGSDLESKDHDNHSVAHEGETYAQREARHEAADAEEFGDIIGQINDLIVCGPDVSFPELPESLKGLL